MKLASRLCPIVLALLAFPVAAQERIEIESVLITVIEEVKVPAREAGELSAVSVREGQLVKAGEVIAQVDDADARLAARKAALERDIAAKDAENDIQVRFAKKSKDVTAVELQRALKQQNRFDKSISDSELDRLRLTDQRAGLEIEQAEHDLVKAKLTERLKGNDVDIAKRAIDRRQVVSPIDGMVVQIHQRRGEWVEPGATVVRLLRINRLRAEGQVNMRDIRGDLTGRAVSLSVTLPDGAATSYRGKVVFVSPEINPVNGLVKVWAEIDNPRLLLRPGMRAAMTIEPATE